MTARAGKDEVGWALALSLLAAGCDSRGSVSSPDEPQNSVLADPTLTLPELSPEEAARLRTRAVAALAAVLPGAAAATYANVRPGSGGSICGIVDPSAGAMPEAARPFIVLADGTALVSTSPGLRLTDPNDPFPDLYMQYCASTEELRRIGMRLEELTPPAVTVNASEPIESLPLGDGFEEPPEPVVENLPEPRQGDDESFFNSVLRSPRGTRPPG